jgi:hypothetical protein
MSAAMRGESNDWIQLPGGLVKVKICRLCGMLATDHCNEPVYEPSAYDPTHPELMTSVVRDGGVYEDVMPADRVPPPCTLPHGVPPAGEQAPGYYSDPSLATPSVQRAAGDEYTTPSPAVPALGTPGAATPTTMPTSDSTRPPVAQPPAFMTERPAPVSTIVPAATERQDRKRRTDSVPAPVADPAVAPIPDAPKVNPILPGAPAQDPAPPVDGVIPGSTIEKTPPAAPKKPREPQFQL